MCDRCGSDVHPAKVRSHPLFSSRPSELVLLGSLPSVSYPRNRTVLLSGESTSISLLPREKKSSPNVNDSRNSAVSKETFSRLIPRRNGETAMEDGEDGATTALLKDTGEMFVPFLPSLSLALGNRSCKLLADFFFSPPPSSL